MCCTTWTFCYILLFRQCSIKAALFINSLYSVPYISITIVDMSIVLNCYLSRFANVRIVKWLLLNYVGILFIGCAENVWVSYFFRASAIRLSRRNFRIQISCDVENCINFTWNSHGFIAIGLWLLERTIVVFRVRCVSCWYGHFKTHWMQGNLSTDLN